MINIKELIGEKDFYAKEFILWVWYNFDVNEGQVTLKNGTNIIVLIEDKLILKETIGQQEDFFKGGSPSESIEAKYALKTGKTIKECKIKILKPSKSGVNDFLYEWIFNFKSEGFKISGIKLPQITVKENVEKFKQRVVFLEELYSYIFEMYENFLTIRMEESTWKPLEQEMTEWIDVIQEG